MVKTVSATRLLKLGKRARKLGSSAIGRPAWTEAHSAEIKDVVLVAICPESAWGEPHTCWRCYVGTSTKESGVVAFTIDIEMSEFDRLDTVTDPWTLAEILLYPATHLPIDAR
ncbi:hypothetical protein [Amycolatopsis sp. NPDC059021]|uniref:hypothetical protein n=1 Tax=Amycolatopsis sp. NPDC059021 TaxID=3346704 RepID=UPI00366FDF7B